MRKKGRIILPPRGVALAPWRRQRGMIVLGAGGMMGAMGAVVNLDGGACMDAGLGATFARIEIRTSGQVWCETDQSGDTQLDASTDWIIPNGDADTSYDVMASLDSGDTPTGPALDTWHAISTNRGWTLTPSGIEILSCSLTIQIRKDGGAALDSGVYTLYSASAG